MADPRQTSIRQSLLNNMLLLVLLVGLAILVTTFIGADRLTRSLSRILIGQTIDRTEAQVAQFMTPVRHAQTLLQHWTASNLVDPPTGQGARNLIWPLLKASPQLYGALIVDPQRQVLQVNRLSDVWTLNLVDGSGAQPARTMALESESLSWGPIDYQFDPADRLWYQHVLDAPLGEIRWTEAYQFIGSGLPGITASSRIQDSAGKTWVVALDVLLEDISEFTRNFDVGYQGLVLVTDDTGQIIGLPNLPQFAARSARDNAFLKRPHELDFALAMDAATAFQSNPNGSVEVDPVRFRSDGRHWWGQAKWIPLNAKQQLFTGVLVPEDEMLGSIQQLRLLLVSVVLAVVAFAVYRAIALSRRYAVPITRLANQSLLMSQGDLTLRNPIQSSLLEVTNLAKAHELMRSGLANLLKLEDDLKLARQIQQKTFPQEFPTVRSYQIAAGSRPAEATGGDTYDVMGIRRQGKQATLTKQHPDEVYLVLSDATGHGMGPALTAAEVRSLFRMGVRLGRPLTEIITQMNEQLVADSHGGRFVTAWLGQLNPADHQLHVFSAGQAPILHYQAANDSFLVMQADAPPLGVLADMAPQTVTIDLAPGDIIATLSDGAFEAKASDGERFGQTRVEQLIRVNRTQSAEHILAAIDRALIRFLDQQDAHDDQTGIILKCVSRPR